MESMISESEWKYAIKGSGCSWRCFKTGGVRCKASLNALSGATRSELAPYFASISLVRLPRTARMRMFASRTSTSGRFHPLFASHTLEILNEFFFIRSRRLDQGIELLPSYTEGLQICLARLWPRGKIDADGGAVT